jgi:acyl-CoA synthetase (AMP-forming)/AMP-acid ligase II
MADGARLVDARTGHRWDLPGLRAATAPVRRRYEALPPGVVLARTGNTPASMLHYLGAWTAGRPVALLSPALPRPTLETFVVRYRPVAVVGLAEWPAIDGAPPPGYVVDDGWWRRAAPPPPAPHPELAILLATSGTTGDPRLVRLSRRAVVSNALSIVDALAIRTDDVAPTSLAPCHSYGLSVVNSHLAAGAEVLVADGGVFAPEFWHAVDIYRATSLAGVPQQYEMLVRARWRPANAPSVRTLTQAGGRMREDLALALYGQIDRLFLMYGQTEATARIAVLPPDLAGTKPGSVGRAVPGGTISIRPAHGRPTRAPDITGEIVYTGPNVMMGYADGADDLARGDDLGGVLSTGDIGRLDRDGHLWLTGRMRRVGKVFGTRVNLDDIERIAARQGTPAAAVAADDRVVLWCPRQPGEALAALRTTLAEQLGLHRSGFDVRATDGLPMLPNGKVDYRALETAARQ